MEYFCSLCEISLCSVKCPEVYSQISQVRRFNQYNGFWICREKIVCVEVQTVYGVIAMHYPKVPKISDLMMSWLIGTHM